MLYLIVYIFLRASHQIPYALHFYPETISGTYFRIFPVDYIILINYSLFFISTVIAFWHRKKC